MSQTNLLLTIDGLNIFFRLSLALLVGGLIGWEREIADKPAGLRTHMLVSFGAAIFVLVGIEIGATQASADALSRIVQGIVQGIGVLGAGEIFGKSHRQTGTAKISGLTSAAAIWVSGALGVAAGCGLWAIALSGALICFLILWLVKKWE